MCQGAPATCRASITSAGGSVATCGLVGSASCLAHSSGWKKGLSAQHPHISLLYSSSAHTLLNIILLKIMPDALAVPPPPSCVYNIPLALDHTLLHTRGPLPHFAKNRNANLLADCQHSIFGPMPPQQFIDHFLPPPIADDRADMLESLDAFKSVPPRGGEASEIYGPLVSTLSCPSILRF